MINRGTVIYNIIYDMTLKLLGEIHHTLNLAHKKIQYSTFYKSNVFKGITERFPETSKPRVPNKRGGMLMQFFQPSGSYSNTLLLLLSFSILVYRFIVNSLILSCCQNILELYLIHLYQLWHIPFMASKCTLHPISRLVY